MEMNDIITFITNLGFPIVCVFALWQSIKDYMKEQKEEMKRLRELLEKNVLIIQKILDFLDITEEGDKND